jgi:hypothetical protein
MERFSAYKLNAVTSALFFASAAINGSVAFDARNDASRATAQAEAYEQSEGNEAMAQALRAEADSANQQSVMFISIAGLNLAAGGLFAA